MVGREITSEQLVDKINQLQAVLSSAPATGSATGAKTPKKITPETALTVTTSAALAHGLDVIGFVGQG